MADAMRRRSCCLRMLMGDGCARGVLEGSGQLVVSSANGGSQSSAPHSLHVFVWQQCRWLLCRQVAKHGIDHADYGSLPASALTASRASITTLLTSPQRAATSAGDISRPSRPARSSLSSNAACHSAMASRTATSCKGLF